MQFNELLQSWLRRATLQHNEILCDAMPCNVMLCTVLQRNLLQDSTIVLKFFAELYCICIFLISPSHRAASKGNVDNCVFELVSIAAELLNTIQNGVSVFKESNMFHTTFINTFRTKTLSYSYICYLSPQLFIFFIRTTTSTSNIAAILNFQDGRQYGVNVANKLNISLATTVAYR